MRAKMSDRGGRRQSADLPNAAWLAWSAESEARAILAETEPRGGCGPFDPASWYEVRLEQSGAVAGPLCALPALAESLRSFVEA